MVRKSAWVLNFDAEDELARPGGTTPSKAMLARFDALAEQVGALLLPGDVLVPVWTPSGGTSADPSGGAESHPPRCTGDGLAVGDAPPRGGGLGVPSTFGSRRAGAAPGRDLADAVSPRGGTGGASPPVFRLLRIGGVEPDDSAMWAGAESERDERVGRAWCPTPRAQRVLQAVGAILLPSPPVAVLRAVNHRRFCAELGQGLPGARYSLTMEEVTAALRGPSPTGQWLLKRPFGYAGRGRLKLDPARPGELARAQTWIKASLRGGEGLQVEPLVERLGDFALHGHLARTGDLVLGEPTRQDCDVTGAWLGSARATRGDLSPEERTALFEEARRTAAALHEAGYFGPFGIDGFRHLGPSGERRFHARGEINARYSMGWAAGMGDRRPDL